MQLRLRMASPLLRNRTYFKSADTDGVERRFSDAG
jgi:hypothetical protein